MGEWLLLAWWDVGAFFGNNDFKSHAAALRAVNAQKTPEDKYIYTVVESEIIEHSGFLGVLDSVGKSAKEGMESLLKTLGFVLRFFPWILISLVVVYVLFVLKPFPLVGKKQ